MHKIVDAATLSPTDQVIEIGCGEGWMSFELAQKCGALAIMELDPYFLQMTQDRLAEFTHVQYFPGDALKTTLAPIPFERFKMVANIPYQISAPLTKLLIASRERLIEAVLLVQLEFAKKLVAKPGSDGYTSLSLYTQFYLETDFLFPVSRKCFRPIPKVDSAVIRLKPRASAPFNVDEDLFFQMIRSAFWGRRKTLMNSLSKNPFLRLDPAFKQSPFFIKNPNIRGETLDLEGFHALFLEIKGFIRG